MLFNLSQNGSKQSSTTASQTRGPNGAFSKRISPEDELANFEDDQATAAVRSASRLLSFCALPCASRKYGIM